MPGQRPERTECGKPGSRASMELRAKDPDATLRQFGPRFRRTHDPKRTVTALAPFRPGASAFRSEQTAGDTWCLTMDFT